MISDNPQRQSMRPLPPWERASALLQMKRKGEGVRPLLPSSFQDSPSMPSPTGGEGATANAAGATSHLRELVLSLGLEVAGVMTLVQLVRRIAGDAVAHAAALDRGARQDLIGPAQHVFVFVRAQERRRIAVLPALGEAAVPREDRDVGDGVIIARDEATLRQLLVEHVELTLYLHGEAVDRIFHLERRVGVEMAEAAAEIGRAAHLPEQPGEALGARGLIGRQEGAELLGEISEDRTGLEHADRLCAAAVHQRRDLGIRVHLDEARAELLALTDPHEPGVVLGALVAEREQLLEHNRDLLPVRRGERIELQRMLADGKHFLPLRTRRRSVDRLELAAVRLVPDPDFRGHVVGRGRHGHTRVRDEVRREAGRLPIYALFRVRQYGGRGQCPAADTALATAAPKAPVPRPPPMSGVRVPGLAMTRSSAASIACAARLSAASPRRSPSQAKSIAAEPISDDGLATFFPAMSGAEPCCACATP